MPDFLHFFSIVLNYEKRIYFLIISCNLLLSKAMNSRHPVDLVITFQVKGAGLPCL